MNFSKRLFSFLAIMLVIGLVALVNQAPTDYATQNVLNSIIQPTLKAAIQQGFEKGKIEVLYPHFDELISICINDVEEVYLAYNGKTALQNFFTVHPPAQFEINHTGTNKSGIKAYFIGDYEDSQQEKFRIYILTEKELIQSIEINKKEETS